MVAIAGEWIEDLSPGRSGKARLFCFPYAGGNASVYRPWPRLLPPSLAVSAIKLPGRETRLREPQLDDLPSLVAPIVSALAPQLGSRFFFFGHSFGALLAFETARALARMHERAPHVLFASGCRAPQCPPAEVVHHLPDAEFIERVRAMNGTPDEIFANPELVELILPALKADFAAYERYLYTPGSQLSSSIAILGGLEDDLPLEDLKAWREHTAAEFEMHLFPGDHFFIADAREQVLRTLAGVLASAR